MCVCVCAWECVGVCQCGCVSVCVCVCACEFVGVCQCGCVSVCVCALARAYGTNVIRTADCATAILLISDAK